MRGAIAALLTLLGTCFNLLECRAASVADIKVTRPAVGNGLGVAVEDCRLSEQKSGAA